MLILAKRLRQRPATQRSIIAPFAKQYDASPRHAVRFAGVLAIAIVLSGCAAAVVADLPSPVGLPADAPRREESATPAVYPDVHEQAPERDDALLTEEQRARLKRELRKAGERQGGARAE